MRASGTVNIPMLINIAAIVLIEKMVDAGLTALLTTLKDNPRMARIIYIDAMLVQELHNQATIRETMLLFDRMIHAFVMLMMPNIPHSEREKKCAEPKLSTSLGLFKTLAQ